MNYLRGFECKEGQKLFDKTILVIGASADKDVAGIVSELQLLFSHAIVTRSQHPRSMETGRIAAELVKYGFKPRITQDVPQALAAALSIAGEETGVHHRLAVRRRGKRTAKPGRKAVAEPSSSHLVVRASSGSILPSIFSIAMLWLQSPQ